MEILVASAPKKSTDETGATKFPRRTESRLPFGNTRLTAANHDDIDGYAWGIFLGIGLSIGIIHDYGGKMFSKLVGEADAVHLLDLKDTVELKPTLG